jgi:precorrin-8X/cobalt-precorrin-8 methylmutase
MTESTEPTNSSTKAVPSTPHSLGIPLETDGQSAHPAGHQPPAAGAAEPNDMRQMTGMGRRIEDGSFGIIDAEIGPHDFNSEEYEVVRRVIHATADFEYKHLMRFGGNAIDRSIEALVGGCNVVVDVKMISAGLNPERLASYGCGQFCFISDDDVIATAKERDTTRAIESIRKAHRLQKLAGSVVAIGNAPTALLEVVRLYREEGVRPALVIGVPVGFVSAVESKEELLKTDIPCIVSRGRKGGTTIAVSILHALLLLSTKRKS